MYGEDTNRLRFALDKAEIGSDLEYQIICEFLASFARRARLEALEEAAKLAEYIRAIPCNCSINGLPTQYCHKAIAHEIRCVALLEKEQGERT